MNSQDRQARIIAAGLFVSLFFIWGGGYNTSPVFLGALLKAFGWSHSKVSWMPSAIILAVGITGPFAGWLLDRLEARIVMGVGAALAGASFIAASRATSFTELLIANLTLGVGLGASAWLPASVVIANWFGERRGTALGLATAGMESGGMAMAFMTGHIISQYGWRAAYFALSIPALVLVLPLLAIVVRTRPAGAAKQKAGEPGQALPGYEVGEAIRTRVFWMLAVAQLTWGLSAGAVIHIVAYLTGIGYTMGFATRYRLYDGVRDDCLRLTRWPRRARQANHGRAGRSYWRQERPRDSLAPDSRVSHLNIGRSTWLDDSAVSAGGRGFNCHAEFVGAAGAGRGGGT